MCGIAGIITPSSCGFEPDGAAARRILSSLAHRGPDDRGVWSGSCHRWNVWLGHTRLVILDPTTAARQPMVDPVSGCVLVYNGEIYNFADLRRELASESDRPFTSSGDTEVVLRAYLRWGDDCVRRFRGMFAFGIFDPRRKRVLLARDHFGIKPLYLSAAPRGFAFGSEVRAVMYAPWVERTLDPSGLMSYLAFGSLQEPFTLIEGIRSLPAGHTMGVTIRDDEVEVEDARQYWRPTARPLAEGVTAADAPSEIRRRLTETVRCHLVSDVPLGAFLSGGIDSSSIVALMAEEARPRVKTINVAFAEDGYDESHVARAVARRYGTDHAEVRLSAHDFLRDVPSWLRSLDQPSADGANTWIISRACREAGITVALSGVGGDELFEGYPTFARAARAARVFCVVGVLPVKVRRRLANGLRTIGRSSVVTDKVADWLAGDGSTLSTYLTLRRLFMDTWGTDLVEPNIRQVAGDLPIHLGTFRQLLEDSSDIDARSATSIFESVVYMRNTLLRDADQAGMAHSVEIRVPFVDAELADFALSLPPGVRRATRSPKPLLSAAMADRLDRAWIDRPKMGFSLPFDEWLRGPLRGEVESALETLSGRPLRGHAARAAWDGFLRGDRRLRAGHILSLYVLGRWMQMNGVERGHAVAPEELMSPCTS